jgi:hypothetical protein
MKSFFYLYGISRTPENLAQVPKIGVPGVDGVGVVESIVVGDLTAWYSPVGAVEFGSDLAQRMEDLEWLAQTSVRHQKVVAEIAAHMPVVPARFGTVFVLRRNLVNDVAARAHETKKILEKITDAEEWGVKVLRRRTVVVARAVADTSGAEYLRQKAALQAKREVGTSPEIVTFANELSKHAVAVAPVGKLSSAQRELEWQASFLIKKKDKPKWDAVLRDYATKWSDGREIECTGPWPPYSFV